MGEEFGEVPAYAPPVLLCFSWDPMPLTHGDRYWAGGISGSPVDLPKFSKRLIFLEHANINQVISFKFFGSGTLQLPENIKRLFLSQPLASQYMF